VASDPNWGLQKTAHAIYTRSDLSNAQIASNIPSEQDRTCPSKDLVNCNAADYSPRLSDQNHMNNSKKVFDNPTPTQELEPIWKLLREEQSADQSVENTRSDKPSNLIPHDKYHAGDPMSFVPIFHSESTRYKSSNNATNITWRRGTNPASNVMKITTPQTWAW
jgi:hypothetical protein